MSKNKWAILCAILAALLYAVNVPLSKILLANVSPTMMAGALYIGAGVGVGILLAIKKARGRTRTQQWLDRGDLPYVLAMVALDIAAPIFLMFGVAHTASANVSLLNNFEIVATSLIALLLFGEKISKRLWCAIALVTAASILLGFEGRESLAFGKGSCFVILACICWGVENNCTRSISHKSSKQIVVIKGLFSGTGGVVTALLLGESFPALRDFLLVMLVGFVAYGLSIDLYILAQKDLGAAKTSAFYSLAPFLGVGCSFVILGERPHARFYAALAIMALSTLVMIRDSLQSEKTGEA